MLMPEQTVDQAWWAAPLRLDEGTVRRAPGADLSAARDLPEVRIEPHRTFALDEIDGAPAPPLDSTERYFVLRFDFSLRPKPRVRIEWARLRVELVSDAAGRHARAEDLHPRLVERSVEHHVSLAINPSLKFQQVEVGVGSRTHSYDYEALEPMISAAGIGGDDLSWDYTATEDGTLSGSKRMHALIAVPPGMTEVRARLSFSADLRVDRVLLPAHLEARDGATQEAILVQNSTG